MRSYKSALPAGSLYWDRRIGGISMIKCEAARPTVRKRAISILIIAAFVIGFFGAAALALYLPDREIKTHSPTEEFAAFLDSRAPKLMGLYGIPGVSIALVRDGQIVYSAA